MTQREALAAGRAIVAAIRDYDAQRFNPNHAPAGAGGGQFTSAPGAGGPKGQAQAAHQAHVAHQAHQAHEAHLRHLAAHPVAQGERGKRVSGLQDQLNALGARPPLAADGIFGPKTLAAVKAFQRAHGLKPDGLVGPRTTRALEAAAVPHAKAAPAHGHHTPAHHPATAARAMAHEPLGKPGGPGLWGMKGAQLPAYIQHVRNDLMQSRGMPESLATEMAIGIVRDWAAGRRGASADTQAKAVTAMAEFERLRAKAKATRSAPMDGCDGDGLDGSWDGDLSGLPDLTGLGVQHFQAAEQDMGMRPRNAQAQRLAKLGGGARFRALSAALAAKGAHDPGALAAWIGSRKYGKQEFHKLAAHARGGKGGGMSRSELFRSYPLEDFHILRTADGDGSGRVIEAYATVFDTPTEISDHQGHYEEEIDRAAFNKRIADLERSRAGFAAAKVFYNHAMTLHGTPSDRYSMPVAVCEQVRAEARGPITRARYLDTPLGNEVLEMWRSGAITAQSFTGAIIRSTPELRRGEKYRPRDGRLTRVRRLELGLKEFGPTPFPAYAGAELVGVRMSPLGTYGAVDDDEVYDEALPPDEEAAAGGPQDDLHPSRMNAHRLWQLRNEEACREAGIVLPGRG